MNLIAEIGFNSIVTSSIVIIIAIGFSVIYKVSGFFHFTHAAIFTVGGYLVYSLNTLFGLPLLLSFICGVTLTGILSCCLEIVVYRPMRNRSSGSHTILIASLGLYVVIQNILSLSFDDNPKSFSLSIFKTSIDLIVVRATLIQLIIIMAAVLTIIFTYVLLRMTRLGKKIRAIATDNELAEISGIDKNAVILMTVAIGSMLAAIVGAFHSLDIGLTTTMGLNVLLTGLVAAIAGGLQSMIRLIIASFLIGIAQQVGMWFLGSQWQDAIVFILLFVIAIMYSDHILENRVII